MLRRHAANDASRSAAASAAARPAAAGAGAGGAGVVRQASTRRGSALYTAASGAVQRSGHVAACTACSAACITSSTTLAHTSSHGAQPGWRCSCTTAVSAAAAAAASSADHQRGANGSHAQACVHVVERGSACVSGTGPSLTRQRQHTCRCYATGSSRQHTCAPARLLATCSSSGFSAARAAAGLRAAALPRLRRAACGALALAALLSYAKASSYSLQPRRMKDVLTASSSAHRSARLPTSPPTSSRLSQGCRAMVANAEAAA